MRKTVKKESPTIEIPKVMPDLFVGSRLRQWGWVRFNVTTEAVLLKQRCTADELREIAAWCVSAANWLDSKATK